MYCAVFEDVLVSSTGRLLSRSTLATEIPQSTRGSTRSWVSSTATGDQFAADALIAHTLVQKDSIFNR